MQLRRGPRLRNDPDKYIWRQYGAFAVVALDPQTGLRAYVGTFPTYYEARRARDEFLAGKRPAHPKGVVKVRTRDGAAFKVRKGKRRLLFGTLAEAAEVAMGKSCTAAI